MRTALAVLVLALLVLPACESVDAPREPDVMADVRTQSIPLAQEQYLEITIPVRTGLTPALVPPVTTFEWRTIENAEEPDSVRWILKDVENSDYVATITYIHDNFDDLPWSPWHAYDPAADTGTSWTTPPTDFGGYIFTVHGKKGGVINRFLDERFNVRRIRVSRRSTGPILTLTSDFFDPVVTSVVSTPVTIVSLPAGTPIEFCWTADASAYGGVVSRHRYGWDIIDPDDELAWDVVEDYDGGEFCAEPVTFFSGTHTFYVEVFDNSGYSSRVPVRINVTDPPEPMSLDIRPGACPNPLNPKSRGALWVALPGSGNFDVATVDLESVSLGTFPKPGSLSRTVQSRIQDVTSPAGGECDCSGRGADGYDDLNLRFPLRDLDLGGVAAGEEVELALYGRTLDGEPFIATDCVRVVGLQGGDDTVEEGPDTRIIEVMNSYLLDGQLITEPVNFSDADPDTVPYGSWITVFYEGIPDPATATLCDDPINRCIGFQKNYTSVSTTVPGYSETTAWLPFSPEDSDTSVTPDSTSLNMGSVDYTVRFRSVDEFGGVDPAPAELPIVANFAPTLTSFDVENQDGSSDGDIVWDWWNPVNFHGSIADTLDLSEPPRVWVVREFYFLVKARGHDHPKERGRGGVKAWRYLIRRSDDPTTVIPLGRSGAWVEGFQVDALRDTVRFTVRYDYHDDPGGWKAWAALPDWLGHSLDVTVQGRDTAPDEGEFRQFMFVRGEKTLINAYPVASLGRVTGEETARIDISLTRGDMPASAEAGRHRRGLTRR